MSNKHHLSVISVDKSVSKVENLIVYNQTVFRGNRTGNRCRNGHCMDQKGHDSPRELFKHWRVLRAMAVCLRFIGKYSYPLPVALIFDKLLAILRNINNIRKFQMNAKKNHVQTKITNYLNSFSICICKISIFLSNINTWNCGSR